MTYLTILVKFNPVQVLIILCHPGRASFNHAAAAVTRRTLEELGHTVVFHDLYAEGFNPVLSAAELLRRYSLDETVQTHTRELEESAGLVILHPDWWGQPPAVLKGWIDRVFRPGIAYEFEGAEFSQKSKVNLLAGKRGLVLCTTDSTDEESARRLQRLWNESILGYCGMSSTCVVFTGMHQTAPAERQAYLDRVRQSVTDTFPREQTASATA